MPPYHRRPVIAKKKTPVGTPVMITALPSKPDPIRDLNDSKQVHDRRRRPSNHVFQPLSACNNSLPSSNLVHSYQEGSDHRKHASSFLWNLRDYPAFNMGISAASISHVHTSQ